MPAGSADSASAGDLRLVAVDGSGAVTTSSGVGVLQIYWDGVWGTARYESSWSWEESRAACLQMGFAHAHSQVGRAAQNNRATPQWLYNVACRLNETNLISCAHRQFGTMTPSAASGTSNVVLRCVAGEGTTITAPGVWGQ